LLRDNQLSVLGDVGEARVRRDDLDTKPHPGLEVENEATALSDVCEVREGEA